MGRRVTIDEGRLLRVAREVIAEQGADVSTAVVAKRAGVAVGSLFRRWPTKRALLDAAGRVEPDAAWARALDARPGRDPLRIELLAVGTDTLAVLRAQLPGLALSWSRHAAAPADVTDPTAWMLAHLTAWLDRERRAGRLATDAAFTARALLGALLHHVLLGATPHAAAAPSDHALLDGLADLLLGPANPPDPRRKAR